MESRVGLGHDTHRLAPGRKFVLGGVTIDFELGPVGHSDADVLLHAITDAILGGAGLGDIGEWFPDDDPQWKGANSATLLAAALTAVRGRGWHIVNLDCTIFAQRPKLMPHKPAIRRRIAELMDIAADTVNIKAKTGEEVGPIGRGEAVAADAIVLLRRTQEETESP